MSRIKYKQLDLTGKILNADLSTFISIAYGGTGLTTLGSALQVLRVNSAGTALEYATLVSNPGTVTSVAISGGTTGLTTSGGPITSNGTITLAGTLATTNGGTGLTTIGTSLQVLRVNSAGTALEFATLTQNPGTVTSVSFSGGTTGLTASGSPITSSGTFTLSGTLNVANGGTGLTALGSALQFIRVNSSGTALEYVTITQNPGTVTSVAVSGGSTGLTTSGGPITSAGTITFNGTLNTGHGGTGLTTLGTANQVLAMNSGGLALTYRDATDLITLQTNVFTYIGSEINFHSTSLDNVGAPKVLFLPSKGGAFRVGNTGIINTRWNVSNIGGASVAFGGDTLASGQFSFAGGWFSQATADYSFAYGNGARAFGQYSFAVGNSTLASGLGSVAFNNSVASGNNSTSFAAGQAVGLASTAFGFSFASGDNSVTFGDNTFAKAYGSLTVGAWNDNSDSPGPSGLDILSTDRIFQIGNGTSSGGGIRSNALTVLRNGNFGFGKLIPSEKVDINGNLRLSGDFRPNNQPGASGQVLTSTGATTAPVWNDLDKDFDTLHWQKATKDVKVDFTVVISGDYVLENATVNIVGSSTQIAVGSLIFKEVGQIFIGGNLVLKDSTIVNDGILSVGGGIIFVGTSSITGTGVIV